MQSEFMAPWARGHGLARMLVESVEARARTEGLRTLNLDVRETQGAAIKLYESLGFSQWGTHPRYARVRGRDVAGLFFYKELSRSEEHTSELQSLMRISYAVFCLKKKT